jgi:DNA-binding NarL/FixJ family response regulator
LARHRHPTVHASRDPIRLVVIEPRAIFGVGVRRILEDAPGIEVVAFVNSPVEAISIVDESAPDVLLVDMPPHGSNSDEATRRLRQGAPQSALVVIGREDDDASIVGAVEAGAVAHVAEMAEPAELVATIRRAADGEDPLRDELIGRPDLMERIVDEMRGSILADAQPASILTERELDVLVHVARGMRNRQIADALGLSVSTVKNHLSAILHKLGVPNRTHAVTYASRQGWLDLADLQEHSTSTP